MDITQIAQLETQIDTLLRTAERLQAENDSLRQKLTAAHREKIRLQELNQKASSKVKRVIHQLQEELA